MIARTRRIFEARSIIGRPCQNSRRVFSRLDKNRQGGIPGSYPAGSYAQITLAVSFGRAIEKSAVALRAVPPLMALSLTVLS